MYILQVVPLHSVWYAVLFILCVLIGLGSQYATVKMITVSLADLLPPKASTERWIALGTCIALFLGGIYMCSSADTEDLASVLQFYTGGIASPVISILHVFSLIYVYGTEHFLEDIHAMLGDRVLFGLIPFRRFKLWFSFSLKFLTHPTLVFILVIMITGYSPPSFSDNFTGTIAMVVGQTARVMVLAPIFIVPAVHFVRDKQGTVKDRFRRLLQPTEDWGPMREKDRIASGYKSTKAQIENKQKSTKRTDHSSKAKRSCKYYLKEHSPLEKVYN